MQKTIKKTKAFTLVQDGPQGRMFVLEDPSLDEQRKFFNNRETLNMSMDFRQQGYSPLVDVLNESGMNDPCNQSMLLGSVSQSQYFRQAKNITMNQQTSPMGDQSIICDVWPLT